MLEEILNDLRGAIAKAHEALKRELSKVRTGRANSAMLDGVRVDYYGTPTPIGQMANVSVPEARLIVIKPWDKSTVKLVEKAIRDADLGFNPQIDSDVLRIPIPPLTEERRREMVKLAKKYGEDCKVALRKSRHEALDLASGVEEDGGASADDVDRAKKKVEELATESYKTVDSIITNKEKDILEV
jgi:ribosome recycling factor